MKKKYVRIFFLAYLLLLIKGIVFKYPLWQLKEIMDGWQKDVLWEGLHGANFELFKTIKLYIRHWDNKGLNSFGNLIGNLVAFVPFGYFLPRILKPAQNIFCCVAAAFLFSSSIEVFQLLSAFGVFDVDDILLNCAGALLGYILFKIMKPFLVKKGLIE